MIISRWLSMGVLALGLCGGLPALGEPLLIAETAAPGSFVRVPLLDRDPCDYPKIIYCTKPTDVWIGRYVLKIPYNLIGQWPPDNDFIELLPTWPKLRGAVKDDKPKGNIDVVHILIHTGRPQRPTEEGIRALLQRLNLSPPIPLQEIGLLEYRNPRANNIVYAYIPIDQTGLLPRGQPLYIHTGGPGDINTMRCQFGYTLRDGMYVTVRFARKHIKDWKSITISVRDLVESFIQE